MPNPFKMICGPDIDEYSVEDINGQFSCQESGCYDVMREAKYIREKKLLSWICNSGHKSKIEGFEID